MEKNKKHLPEDAFIKKYLQEVDLESPSTMFTNNLMNALSKEEEKVLSVAKPLISKRVWFAVAAFVVTCLYFVFQKGTSLGIELPTFKTNALSNIQIPNIFDSITVSNTIVYAFVLFALMAFVQIYFLKSHFEKRLN